MDGIDITGTDTSFSAASQALGDQSYDEFLEAFHAEYAQGRAEWVRRRRAVDVAAVQVGDQTGGLEQLCNAAEVLVHVGDRVYVFDWGNSTFDGTSHMNLASWKELLKTVHFDPASAK